MANPRTQTFIEPYYYSRAVSDWNPSSIKSAISVMSSGYFSSAAMLADSILGDGRVQAALGTRIKALIGLPLAFEAADEKNARAKKAAETLKLDFWTIAPEQTLYQMLSYGWLLGVCLTELQWQRKDARWVPQFKVWHPSNLRHDPRKREWLVKVGDTGKEMTITPGDGKWFLFTPFGEERVWTNALIRSLAIPFLMKGYAVGDWARHSEVHGGAIKHATVPASTTDSVMKQIKLDIQELGSDGVMVFREGQKLELLEATKSIWQGFEGLIGWADKEIATTILGQNMTTEPVKDQVGVTGAREVRQDVLESDAEVASTAIHDGGLGWWALFNFGDNVLAPYPVWDTSVPANVPLAEFHLKAKRFVKKNEARAKIGLPPLSAEEGGEEFVEITEPPANPNPSAPSGTSPNTLKRGGGKGTLALASGDDAPGLLAGQQYVDNLVDKAAKRAASVLKADISNIMGIIDDAQDPDELRAKLLAYYEGMSPDELAELTQRSLIMAHLAGRYSEVADGE